MNVHGHGAGDEVLAAVATVLRHVVRERGHIFRLGGDELLVMAPGHTSAAAQVLGAEIIQAFTVPLSAAGRLVPATVSIGVAVVDHPNMALEVALQHADAALYTAKAQGRNRVVDGSVLADWSVVAVS